MRIGIDASRAFKKERTGVEEYAYHVIRQLAFLWPDKEVILYLKKGQEWQIDFPLGKKWRIKFIPFHNFWTQFGLSWEMLNEAPDRFFSPAHVVPLIHSQSIMTVHGLEYEHSPESYSWYSRKLHRFLIKNGCFWSKKIIAISKKTKKDLVELYKIDEKKIQVVYNGFSFPEKILNKKVSSEKFLLFIGRLEERKNVVKVIEVFELLKKKYKYQGKLILAGKKGYGYKKIQEKIQKSLFKKEIIKKGFVTEDEKWMLMKNTDAVIFPSFSEGFGLPILEAQKMNVPIVASKIPASLEIAGREDFLFPPEDGEGMAEMVNRILVDKKFKQRMLLDGQKNIQKFSWEKCAQKTAEVILRE